MNLNIEVSKEEIEAFYHLIAHNVKRLRQEKGVSQLELALAMGFSSVSSIAKAEIGIENKHFNLEHLYKIAKILEINPCDFIQNKKEDNVFPIYPKEQIKRE
jgi:transcriptional regulator with XRE-family HTH domain